MTTDRKKSGVAFWATVVVVVVLLYALSYGPATWLIANQLLPSWAVFAAHEVYRPIGWLRLHGPKPCRDALDWYSQIVLRLF